ncbi:hypothetical protein DACRYDRAFT_116558 [Dacryopinax primogenitus]|uniref:F-box domain-containing protein n=1 Tax=Dacryopinax primogenitus (strain DJM 731) TaxID=1858805 RepID=M5FUG9_DACPD|nr:uncharacterized protein DACRYDRAFT_116558 [Dacryopinax primogenitus]EJU01386.1 hypothetical protein DACRYDRAFT_116558 [Dacryopinax primogenitus]
MFPLHYRAFTWPTHDGTWYTGSTSVKDPNPFGELRVVCEEFLSAAPHRWDAIRAISIDKSGTREAPRFMQDYVRGDGFVLPELPAAMYENMAQLANNSFVIGQRVDARKILMTDKVDNILCRMPQLTSITWRWFPPQLDSPIWPVLDTISGLRKVTFVFNTHFATGFSSIVLSSIIARLVQSIANCKMLEVLQINVPIARNVYHDPTWKVDPILELTWPFLYRLSLSHGRITSAQKFMDFLTRHNRLKELSISDSLVPSIRGKNDQLPRIQDMDLANFRLAKALLPKTSKSTLDPCPTHALRIHSSLSRTDFAALCDILPGIANFLQKLSISLTETSDQDIMTVIDVAPNLVRLEISAREVITVLTGVKRLRSKQTLKRQNWGPMRDWKDLKFPIDFMNHLTPWATAFRKAPRLESLLLRCLPTSASHSQPSMYDDTKSVSLEEAFRAILDVSRVESHMLVGRDMGLEITCYRKEAQQSMEAKTD